MPGSSQSSKPRSWLDAEPPDHPSPAAAYWCEMGFFLTHTATGDHPPCSCPPGLGHDDPDWKLKL